MQRPTGSLAVAGVADTAPRGQHVLLGTAGKVSRTSKLPVSGGCLGSCVEKDLQTKLRLSPEESYD